MKFLYLRIWLTVVAALALFTFGAGWLVQRHLDNERLRAEAQVVERVRPWADLVRHALPDSQAPVAAQASALNDWSERMAVPLALYDASGHRIAESDSFAAQRAMGRPLRKALSVELDDGRRLWMLSPGLGRGPRLPAGNGLPPDEAPRGRGPLHDAIAPPPGEDGPGAPFGRAGPPLAPPGESGLSDRGGPPSAERDFRPRLLPFIPRDWPAGLVLAGLLSLMFVAVAAGAWPVVRSLTRRLETLRRGVETFGAGSLSYRVEVEGRDEVAAVAQSFNQAASRVQNLIIANQSLLANASHELRSPLARLKMAVSMLQEADAAQRATLAREIHTNIAELDALVEEVLLSSRLEAGAPLSLDDDVDLLGLGAEEAARVGARVDGAPLRIRCNERLIRRALRNLLENARRYGGAEVDLHLERRDDQVLLQVCDRGPGVPPDQRDRIFEPFYRMPGHAEREGGVGLGLALVRQIAKAHGGSVLCEPRDGGGSCFVIRLPASMCVL